MKEYKREYRKTAQQDNQETNYAKRVSTPQTNMKH